MLLAVSLHLLLSLPPLALSGFFDGMLGVSDLGALNFYTFFHLIPLTLFVSRNPILLHLSFFGYLDSLLCDLIRTHSRYGILSSDASGGVIIFVRQGSSFSELSTSSLSLLDPYSDYVGVNISPNNSYGYPIRSSPTVSRTDSFFPSILPSFRNLFTFGDFNCHHPLWDSRGTSKPHREEVFDWVISSDLLPLNDPITRTLLHRSSGSRSSPDISFVPSSLALSCSWKMLQNLGSDHLPNLLSIPQSPIFRPNDRPPSFNFQKVC